MSGEYTAVETVRGRPVGRVLARGTREEVEPFWVAGKVAIVWTDTTPIKRLSAETLARRRKSRLRNQLVKKVPLFADELYELELSRRPDFFAGVR